MKQKAHILTDRVFIAGLIILAINDHYLKSYYPSMITGKLSDFVGLFIFPIFLSVILPIRTTTNYFLAAFIFTVWNSPVVEELIHFGKSIGIPLQRTVDPTDLLALIVLPISYLYLKKIQKEENRKKQFGIPLLTVSFIVLTSTTLAPNFGADLNKKYKINATKSDLIREIETMNLELTSDFQNEKDTTYIIRNLIVDGDTVIRHANFTIKEIDKYSILTIKQIATYRSHPAFFTWGQRRQIKKIGEKYIIEELK
jgi:hypothetical protein